MVCWTMSSRRRQQQLSHRSDRVAAARQLAELAHCKAKQTDEETPFAVAARQAGKARSGGKMDDITVMVMVAHVLA